MSTGSIRHNIEITDSTDAERFVEALEKAKAESEEGMESLKTDTDKIFEHDKQVLEEAINTIEAQQQEIEQLQAQLDEWKYEAKCHMDEVAARDKEIERLKAQVDTLSATVNMLAPDEIGKECRHIEALRKAREALDYWRELYGIGLEVLNWHMNGDIETFDSFYDSSGTYEALAEIDKAIGGNEDV